MTIKGIIWDADGTLLDSMEIWDHAPDHYLETLGIEPEPNLGEILFEMSLEQGAKYLIDRYHLPVGVADVLEGIHCQIETFYRREVTLKPGAKELLAEFKQKGYPMILATSGDKDCIRQACERLEIRQYFTELLFCSEVGAGKDRPDIYLEAARKMNCRPDEALVVEDALHAIETAKKIAKKEGILVGISSGAAMYAAMELAKRKEYAGKTIVVLLPDSGDRYYSTQLFQN